MTVLCVPLDCAGSPECAREQEGDYPAASRLAVLRAMPADQKKSSALGKQSRQGLACCDQRWG